ncbi:MAG: hypothetical protein SGI88_15130 [Candidatus Hydrogenedentes bacterium]|nr:hypothetical protein [Candidatus Hydrogenedentota bacterium]
MALSNAIAKLSPSERRLAFIVLFLLAVGLAFVVTLRCLDALASLDASIESQEQLLLQYTNQAALAEPVERAFQSMASQHSSQWTQQEIHDRLRFEITRLSLRQIPQEGAPLPTASNPGDSLVEIRAMPAGALDDSGDGYRSYQINFRTEPTSILNIAEFLQRLQQSAQALRVDFLELVRQPLTAAVSAEFHVTRTVIDDATGEASSASAPLPPDTSTNLARNASFEQFDAQQSLAQDWSAQNASLATGPDATDGTAALVVTATGAPAELYQAQQLIAGATYELLFDASATGAFSVRVILEADGASIPGESHVEPGIGPFRYRFVFTVPGVDGAPVAMRVPSIVLEQSGTILTIDNVMLREYQK